jgi:serine/threonine protein kinase
MSSAGAEEREGGTLSSSREPQSAKKPRFILLGKGTYGYCYLLNDPSDPTACPKAIKYFYRSAMITPKLIPTLKKECDLFNLIYGKGTARFTEWPRENPFAAIDMIYLGNSNLDFFIRRAKIEGRLFPLPAHQWLGYFGQLMVELHRIHELGILLLDIKPANIVISDDLKRASFADFGNSLYEDEAAEAQWIKLTTLSSKPPLDGIFKEQMHSKKTDIYSLGAAFLELLKFDMIYYLQKLYGQEIVTHPTSGERKIKKNKVYLKSFNPQTGEREYQSTIRNTLRFTYGKSLLHPRIAAKPGMLNKLMEEVGTDFFTFLTHRIPKYLDTSGIENPTLKDSLAQKIIDIMMFSLMPFPEQRLGPEYLRPIGNYLIEVAAKIEAGASVLEEYPKFPFHFTESEVTPAPEMTGGGGVGAAADPHNLGSLESGLPPETTEADPKEDDDASNDENNENDENDDGTSDSSGDFEKKRLRAIRNTFLLEISDFKSAAPADPSPREGERRSNSADSADSSDSADSADSSDSADRADSSDSSEGIIIGYPTYQRSNSAPHPLSSKRSDRSDRSDRFDRSDRMQTSETLPTSREPMSGSSGPAGAGSSFRGETASNSAATPATPQFAGVLFGIRAFAEKTPLDTHVATPTARRPLSEKTAHPGESRCFFPPEDPPFKFPEIKKGARSHSAGRIPAKYRDEPHSHP